MGYLDKAGLSRAFTKLKTLIDKKQDKMKQIVLPSSATMSKNKWIKFATIDLSSSNAWHTCSGTLSFTQDEGGNALGTLKFFCRNGNTAGVITDSSLTWVSLSDNSYAGSVAYVKAANGKYDMYYKPLKDYEVPCISLVDCTAYNLFTFSTNSYVASITASNASIVASHASSASSVPWSGVSGKPSTFTPASHTHDDRYYTESEVDSKLSGKANSSHTHTKSQITDFPTSMKNPNSLSISLNGTSQGVYDGSAAKSINVTPSSIGAAPASHSHSYLPLSGGTMSGRILRSAGGPWISARNNTIAFGTTAKRDSYNPVVGQKTTNGAWTVGNLAGDERLVFSYDTDTDFNAGNNYANRTFLPTGGISQEIITSATIGRQSVKHANTAGSVAWSNVSEKPSTYAPSSHSHNYAGSSSAGGNANWANGSTYANYAFSNNGVSTSGSGSAYTATVSGFSLATGKSIVMIPHVTSTTTTPTLNVSGTGAKNIRMRLSSSTSSTIPLIRSGFLTQNKPVKVTYDGTYWVIDDFIQPDANNLYGTLISRGSSAPSSGTAGFIYIQTT